MADYTDRIAEYPGYPKVTKYESMVPVAIHFVTTKPGNPADHTLVVMKAVSTNNYCCLITGKDAGVDFTKYYDSEQEAYEQGLAALSPIPDTGVL